MKAALLTAAFVKTVRHRGGRNADRYGDGHGLLLQVMPSGSKQWVQRLALNGSRNDYGLGGYPAVGLAEARLAAARNMAEARAYRLAAHRGDQPPLPGFERGRLATVAQRTGRPAPCGAAFASGLPFGQAWERCILERCAGWKNPATDLRSWRADLKRHLAGIAGLPVAAVTVDTLREALAPLARPTASKVLRRAGTVFDWAVAGGHRLDNPARTLRATWRGLSNGETKHRRALPYGDVPAFYAKLRAHGTTGAAGALALTLLTALRSKEAREVRYEEFDLDARVWTVPGERMKDSEPFRVPLCDAALAVLEAAGPRRRSGLVFTTKTGRAVTDKGLRKVMADLGADATVHGTARSSFRDWCGENAVARDVAELCLCHKPSGVEAAYARSDLLERRRPVMQAWGAYVTGEAA